MSIDKTRETLVLPGTIHEVIVSPMDHEKWEYLLTITPTENGLLTHRQVDQLVEYLRPSSGRMVTEGQMARAVQAVHFAWLSDAEPEEWVRRIIKALDLGIVTPEVWGKAKDQREQAIDSALLAAEQGVDQVDPQTALTLAQEVRRLRAVIEEQARDVEDAEREVPDTESAPAPLELEGGSAPVRFSASEIKDMTIGRYPFIPKARSLVEVIAELRLMNHNRAADMIVEYAQAANGTPVRSAEEGQDD